MRLAADQYLSHGMLPEFSALPRVNILGVGVTALNMELALDEAESLLQRGEQGYVCVTGVHWNHGGAVG